MNVHMISKAEFDQIMRLLKKTEAERDAFKADAERLLYETGLLRTQLLGMRMEFGEGSTFNNLAAALSAENAVNIAMRGPT